jgi:hypothetical protein
MRKLTLLLAILAVAAMPSVADAKKAKKRAAPKPAPVAQMAPLQPAATLFAGLARDISMIGRPPAAAKGKKGKKG